VTAVLAEPVTIVTKQDAVEESYRLAQQVQGGDMAAFASLYEQYHRTILNFVGGRVRNRPLAEDITGDTFVRALMSVRRRGFTWQGREFGALLHTIARNLVADYFRSGYYRSRQYQVSAVNDTRQPVFSGYSGTSPDSIDNSPEGRPEDTTADYLRNLELLAALKQLTPEQQECIVHRFLRGLSVAETAREMGKNEGAVKALQYRACVAMRAILPEGFAW